MDNFFKLVGCLFIFPLLALKAEMHIDHLAEYDQQTCAEVLQSMDLSDLWNHYLKGQTNLYFDQEAKWLSPKNCWINAQNILELGSGNGTYLSQLSETFRSKNFLGIEKQAVFVEQSNTQFNRPGLIFAEGDAEIQYKQYENQLGASVLERQTFIENPEILYL